MSERLGNVENQGSPELPFTQVAQNIGAQALRPEVVPYAIELQPVDEVTYGAANTWGDSGGAGKLG
jgi:hypothetical protein